MSSFHYRKTNVRAFLEKQIFFLVIFVPSCLYFKKTITIPLYRKKKQKTLIILNRKNKLEKKYSTPTKKIQENIIINNKKIKVGINKINQGKYLFF